MFEVGSFIHTSSKIYDWLRMHGDSEGLDHLPQHAFLLFKAFKTAYDAKDTSRLALTLADTYQGDLFGARTKTEYLRITDQVFQKLPWGVKPCLIINVYSILVNEQTYFSGIVSTESRIAVLGIPTVNFDSAPVRCQISPRSDGLWQISSMFVDWEMVENSKL